MTCLMLENARNVPERENKLLFWCKYCGEGAVAFINEYYPYSVTQWQCTQCDSTYALEEYEDDILELLHILKKNQIESKIEK